MIFSAFRLEKAEKCTEVHAPKGKIISLTSVKKTAVNPTDTKKILLKRKLSLSAEEEEKCESTKVRLILEIAACRDY